MNDVRSGRRSLDPPRPLPDHLRPRVAGVPDDVMIVGNDLRLVLTLDELETIGRALRRLGLEDAHVMLTHREGSPWLEADAVRVPRHAGEQWPSGWQHAPVRLALWRYTLAVYELTADGAVSDDPLHDDDPSSLRTIVRAALEGDSNDAEHDALVAVADWLGITYDPGGA